MIFSNPISIVIVSLPPVGCLKTGRLIVNQSFLLLLSGERSTTTTPSSRRRLVYYKTTRFRQQTGGNVTITMAEESEKVILFLKNTLICGRVWFGEILQPTVAQCVRRLRECSDVPSFIAASLFPKIMTGAEVSIREIGPEFPAGLGNWPTNHLRVVPVLQPGRERPVFVLCRGSRSGRCRR